MNKRIQIDEDLFLMICRYHLGTQDEALLEPIKTGLLEKFEAWEKRELYREAKFGSAENSEIAKRKYEERFGRI